jgi:hypothetical protein
MNFSREVGSLETGLKSYFEISANSKNKMAGQETCELGSTLAEHAVEFRNFFVYHRYYCLLSNTLCPGHHFFRVTLVTLITSVSIVMVITVTLIKKLHF